MTYTLHTLTAGLMVAALWTAPAVAGPIAPPASPPIPSAAQDRVSAEDRAEIEALIERFKQAIVTKDKPGMAALFYNETVVWRASGHPASREALSRMTGEPAQVVQNEGAYDFLDDPQLAAISIEERFYNPVIRSDGQIATVTFDYDFRAQGQIQNWGTESWQLVKTPDGWRILHLLFSVNLQMIAPAPEVRG
jgi:hypothetical protein